MNIRAATTRAAARRTIRRLLIAAVAAACLLPSMSASAQTVTFFTTRAAFEAALTSSATLDFEGMPPDTGYFAAPAFLLDGVQFQASLSTVRGDDIIVAGQHAALPGAPYASDILYTQYAGDPLIVSLPLDTNAAGGWFGSLLAPASGTIEVYIYSGLLASRSLDLIPMADGSSEGFLGVIVTGAPLTQLRIHSGQQVALDNFIYGEGNIAAIPEPSKFAMLLAGLAILGGATWRRKPGDCPRRGPSPDL
ncbi:MAG TPA: PEP-CTERM sorting domain-containing protein [Telluria sp.]|nr:PEP-CTERM sorting domain-containing protein [Telluria sp.]